MSEWMLDKIRIENTISTPIWATNSFLGEASALLDIKHCPKLQSSAI